MRRLVGLLGIGVMVTLAFAARGSYLLEGGKVHYRGERYEKADTLFLKSIEKGLAVTESYMWHGKASIRMKEPDLAEAARAFLEVLKRDTTAEIIKKDEEAHDLAQIAFYYGAQKMLYEPSKADTVIIFLRTGIRLDPKREQNYVLLGRFHLQNEELDAALNVAEELEKINPESPDVAYLKGRVNLIEGDKEEAVELFKVSTDRFNTEIEKLKESIGSQLGIEEEDIDKMVSAIEELEESRDSVSMDDKQQLLTEEFGLIPPQPTAFLRWQSGYAGKNRQLSDAYNWLGKSYMENKKYPEADSALARALELDPENINVMWDKALASYYLRKYKEAVELLKKVEAATEEDYYVHLWLGICYLKDETKDLEKAEKYLTKAMKLDPEQPDVYCNLAVLARERENIEKASQLLKICNALKKEGALSQTMQELRSKLMESYGRPLTLTASELYQEYKANEVAADRKYKDMTLEVSGVIQKIAKDVVDNEMYVALKVGENELEAVKCYFPKEEENIVAQLSKGQKVTIRGKCAGRSWIDVILKGCSVL